MKAEEILNILSQEAKKFSTPLTAEGLQLLVVNVTQSAIKKELIDQEKRKPDRDEFIQLIDDFINHISAWCQFKAYCKEQGYSVKELGFEDPEEDEIEKGIGNCTGKPCGECPYRTNSAKGYFGGNEQEYYSKAITGEEAVECHMTMGTDARKYCSGQAGVRVNSAKMARDPELRKQENIMRSRGDSRSLLFKNRSEFNKHHEIN